MTGRYGIAVGFGDGRLPCLLTSVILRLGTGTGIKGLRKLCKFSERLVLNHPWLPSW